METIGMFISVKTLSEIDRDATNIISGDSNGEFKRYLDKEYKELIAKLHYPFSGADLIIKKAKSIYDILKPIADFYKNEVYANPKKYKVWGHGIEDLFFEEIKIKNDFTIEVFIGS